MGQFWAIVDATLARNFGNLGKLGESIWDNFHWLEDLLQSDIEMPKAVLGPSKLVRNMSLEGNQSRHVWFCGLRFTPSHIFAAVRGCTTSRVNLLQLFLNK
jgi:hypothetical protein